MEEYLPFLLIKYEGMFQNSYTEEGNATMENVYFQ